MSTSSLGRLTLDLVAQTAGFVRGMDKAERASEKWRKSVERNAKAAGVAVAAAGTAAAAGITVAVSGALARMDEMSKTAQRIGTATENIAGLQLAFELGGSSAEGMQTAMIKLADQAAEGSQAFEALGVNVRAADGHIKDTRALIAEVADKFAGYADGASKTALAVELFGKSGAELIPVLNGGAAGFADMDEQARKLGLTIDSETARAAEYFNDQLAIVKKQAEGMATQFTVGLMPSLIAIADGFFATADGADDARSAGAALGDILVGLTKAAMTAAAMFRELGASISAAFQRIDASASTGLLFDTPYDLYPDPGDTRSSEERQRAKAEQRVKAEAEYAERVAKINAEEQRRVQEIHDQLTAGLNAMQQSLERTRSAQADAARQTVDRLRNGKDQAPALPDSGAGKAAKGGGRKRAGSARSADNKAESQYARLLSGLREEAERVQHVLDQMRLNDGIVSQFDRLITLQRDMRANAEQYKGLTEAQTQALQAQAAVVDRLAQQRAVADFRHDNRQTLDDMRFEIEMIGKTADEYDRLSFAREQDLRVKALSAGASAETAAALQAEAQQAKDTYAALQQLRNAREEQAKNAGFSWANVFQDLADNTQSYAQIMEDSATRAFDAMGDAIGELVATGKANFRDLATSVLQDISKMLAKWAIFKTVTAVANSFGFSFQADGGAWANGVQFFASGGVVNRPTLFGHAGGLGVMGEAGPEAILPLRRGRNGKLGVQFDGGGGGQNITINHTTIINNADGSSTTESDAPAAYKTLLDAHFDKRLADALRPGAPLDSAIKQRSR